MNVEPNALVVAWVKTTLISAGSSAHVSTQLDPDRGLPQLVVASATAGWPTLADGRPDPALRSLSIAITSVGKGGDRPDFAGAWLALAPVITSAEGLATSPITVGTNARLVNASGIVTTRDVDPDTGSATYTVTMTVTLALL